MKRFLKWLVILVIVLVVSIFVFVELTWKKTYDAPYPEITASRDSAVIEYGKHLVYGIAACTDCHVSLSDLKSFEDGANPPLQGNGLNLDIPPAVVVAPNITSDKETGIGNYTDQEIARALRYSVGRDGRFLFPMMEYQNLSDEDLTAIISFLRTLPPVKNEVPRVEYKFLGKALLAFGAIKPIGPEETPPKSVKRDSTIEYGKYLTHNVTMCMACHTQRSYKDGSFIGPKFAGRGIFGPDEMTKGKVFVSPNLTNDEETGHIYHWTEEQFMARLHNGRVYEGSPMAWGAFKRCDDMELKAIYRYLKTLEPVKNKVEQVVYNSLDELPFEH